MGCGLASPAAGLEGGALLSSVRHASIGDDKEGNAMALVRWNPTMPWRPSQESWSPFTGMESLRAELDHLFNALLGTMPSSGTQEGFVANFAPARFPV